MNIYLAYLAGYLSGAIVGVVAAGLAHSAKGN